MSNKFVITEDTFKGNSSTVVKKGTIVHLLSSRKDGGIWKCLVTEKLGQHGYVVDFTKMLRLP